MLNIILEKKIQKKNKLILQNRKCLYFCSGEMAEWSIAAVLKTVEPVTVPGVRIPPSPPARPGELAGA
jgi:hypothetical protein